MDNDLNRHMRNTVENMIEQAVRGSEQEVAATDLAAGQGKQQALCTTEQLLQEAVNVVNSAERWRLNNVNSK